MTIDCFNHPSSSELAKKEKEKEASQAKEQADKEHKEERERRARRVPQTTRERAIREGVDTNTADAATDAAARAIEAALT